MSTPGLEVPGRHPVRCVGQLRDGSDDAVREHDRARHAAYHQRHRRHQRRPQPLPAARRGLRRLAAHRVLVDGQETIALPAQIAEQRFLCAEVLVREMPGAAGRDRSGRADLEKPVIDGAVIAVPGAPDLVDDLPLPRPP